MAPWHSADNPPSRLGRSCQSAPAESIRRPRVPGPRAGEAVVGDATEEHHVVDILLPALKSTSPKAPEFAAKAKVLALVDELVHRWIIAAESNDCRFVLVANKQDLPAFALIAASVMPSYFFRSGRRTWMKQRSRPRSAS